MKKPGRKTDYFLTFALTLGIVFAALPGIT
jgi:hypothetical protein